MPCVGLLVEACTCESHHTRTGRSSRTDQLNHTACMSSVGAIESFPSWFHWHTNTSIAPTTSRSNTSRLMASRLPYILNVGRRSQTDNPKTDVSGCYLGTFHWEANKQTLIPIRSRYIDHHL